MDPMSQMMMMGGMGGMGMGGMGMGGMGMGGLGMGGMMNPMMGGMMNPMMGGMGGLGMGGLGMGGLGMGGLGMGGLGMGGMGLGLGGMGMGMSPYSMGMGMNPMMMGMGGMGGYGMLGGGLGSGAYGMPRYPAGGAKVLIKACLVVAEAEELIVEGVPGVKNVVVDLKGVDELNKPLSLFGDYGLGMGALPGGMMGGLGTMQQGYGMGLTRGTPYGY